MDFYVVGKTDDASNSLMEPFVVTVLFSAACVTTTLNSFAVADISIIYTESSPNQENLTVPGDSLADLANPFFEMCGPRTVTIVDIATGL